MNICHSHELLSSAASIFLSVWLFLSSFAGVTGNAVMLWLFYKHASLRTISNRFLASLSIADLLVGLVVGPAWIVIGFWIQPPVLSSLFYFAYILWLHTTAATTFNTCCVSVDRFIAIRFPFRYQVSVTKKRCYTVIFLVWLFSLILPFSVFLVDYEPMINYFVSMIFLAFIISVIPLLVVSFSYVCIFKSAKKQFKRILAGENPTINNDSFKARTIQNLKAIKTIGLVLGACIITWMPNLVLLLVECKYALENNWARICSLNLVVWPWVGTVAFTSSAINPLIYYLRNQEFREAFRRTFRWFPCERTGESTPQTGLKPSRRQILRNVVRPGDAANKETEL